MVEANLCGCGRSVVAHQCCTCCEAGLGHAGERHVPAEQAESLVKGLDERGRWLAGSEAAEGILRLSEPVADWQRGHPLMYLVIYEAGGVAATYFDHKSAANHAKAITGVVVQVPITDDFRKVYKHDSDQS